ncbi:MAG TPA: TlpA disulfide reductase family protein [Acidobacteriaceae bacterium]|nr:TlpA disulfide reductase family protein [Acidobacteriaceae bacterium]
MAFEAGRKKWLWRLPWIVLLSIVAIRAVRSYNFDAPRTIPRDDLAFVQLDGAPLPRSLVADKTLVVNFWAPWCPPCRLEIPWLQHLQNQNTGSVLVIGVVADSSEYAHAQAFMAARGVNYTLVRDTAEVERLFGAVSGLPTTFYITRSGAVAHMVSGLIPEALMSHYVKDTMRQ